MRGRVSLLREDGAHHLTIEEKESATPFVVEKVNGMKKFETHTCLILIFLQTLEVEFHF